MESQQQVFLILNISTVYLATKQGWEETLGWHSDPARDLPDIASDNPSTSMCYAIPSLVILKQVQDDDMVTK